MGNSKSLGNERFEGVIRDDNLGTHPAPPHYPPLMERGLILINEFVNFFKNPGWVQVLPRFDYI